MKTVLEKIPKFEEIQTFLFGLHLGNNKMLVLIVVVLAIAFLLDFFLSRSFLGKKYRIFVAPGVIVHEFSHVIACLVNGAKIKKVSMFDKEGGMVVHEAGKIPFVSPAIISMAPFFVGLASIYFLSRKLGLNQVNIFTLQTISVGAIIEFIKTIVSGINIYDYRNWIIVYLVLSIAVTMVPSWQDLRNSFISLIVLALTAWGIDKFGLYRFNPHFFQNEQLIVLLSTIIFLLILSLILSIIIFAMSVLIRK